MNPEEFEQQQFEQIDSYLQGNLRNRDLQVFEQRMAHDTTFADEVESVKLAKALLQDYGLRQHLGALHQQAMAERKQAGRSLSIFRFAGRMAASLVILMVVLATVGWFTLSGQSVYQANYEQYQLHSMRGEGEVMPVEEAVEKKYVAGAFNECVGIYNSNRAAASVRATFIAGNAYLAISQPEQAIACFEIVTRELQNSPSSQLNREVQWYLVLAYLANNRVEQAEQLYTQLYNDPASKRRDTWLYWQIKLLKMKGV